MKKEVKKEVKQEMEQAFSLWKNQSKNGTEYYTGTDCNEHKLIGFVNGSKRNEKEPDVNVYELNEENKQGDKVCSLWKNTSKDGKTNYLSGVTSDDERIVAFYNDDTSNNKPFIRAYFKNEN